MIKQKKRALLVGTGGGRDMASAVLLLDDIRKQGYEVDLAGFLTPWALHRFEGRLEQPVNPLTEDSIKFRAGNEAEPLSTYYEPELLRSIRRHQLDISRAYVFSLQFGTEALNEGIRGLVSSNGYDKIVALDMGGDILARKKDLRHVFTPITDLSCLQTFANLDAEVSLAVVGPGIDGELHLADLEEIFQELAGRVRQVVRIEEHSPGYQIFKKVKSELDPISHSHTGELLVKVVEGRPGRNIMEEYLKRYGLLDYHFNVELGKEFFDRIFFFDLKEISNLRKEVELGFSDIIDAFKRFRHAGAAGTEVDFAPVPGFIHGGDYGDVMFMLACREDSDIGFRKKALEQLRGKECALMQVKDLPLVDLPLCHIDFHGDFCLVYPQ